VVVNREDLAKLVPEHRPRRQDDRGDGHEFQVIGAMERPAASFPGEETARSCCLTNTMRKMFPSAKETC